MAESHNPILSKQVVRRWRVFDELPQPSPAIALVLFRPGQSPVMLGPGDRLTVSEMRWGGEKTLYEIDLTEHSFGFRCTLLGARETFVATGQVTYAVAEPITIATHNITDARAVLQPLLQEALRSVRWDGGTPDSVAAEQAMRQAVQKVQHRVGLKIEHFDMPLDKALVEDRPTKHVDNIERDKNMALDQVICQVPGEQPVRPGETLVRIDPKTGEMVTKKPRFFKTKLLYYLVSIADRGAHIVTSESEPIILRDFASNREIAVLVSFQAGCPQGNETRVAQGLCHDDTPQKALNAAIEKSVLAFVARDGAGNFIDNYEVRRQELSHFVEEEIRRDIGLDFTARVSLRYEQELDDIVIDALSLAVSLIDSNDEHHLTLSAVLPVHSQYKINAILRYHNQNQQSLRNCLGRVVKAFFAEHVTLHEFCHIRSDLVLQATLEQALQPVLAQEGRKLERLSLTPDLGAMQVESLSFIPLDGIRIPHMPQGYTKHVTIKNDLQLVLQDYGKYKRAGSPDPRTWAENALKQIIRKELFKTTYLDLLLSFDIAEENIKKLMEEAASVIGFSLQHIVTKPDMEENKLLELKLYKFECYNIPTKEANIAVNLQVLVTMNIPELKNIKELLNQNRDVVQSMQHSVQNVLDQRVHQFDPETVYMKFSLPMDAHASDLTLQAYLAQEVWKELEERYHAKVYSVIIQTLDTEITQHIDNLINKSSDFRVEVFPENGRDKIVFKGKLWVVAVDFDGWSRFRTCDFGLSDIRSYFEDTVRPRLKTLSQTALDYKTPEHLDELKETVSEFAIDHIIRRYGVIISIDSFDKEEKASRVAIAEQAESERLQKIAIQGRRIDKLSDIEYEEIEISAMETAARSADIRKLLAARNELITSTNMADADDIQKLDERIQLLNNGAKRPQWSESATDEKEGLQELKAFRARQRLTQKDRQALPPPQGPAVPNRHIEESHAENPEA